MKSTSWAHHSLVWGDCLVTTNIIKFLFCNFNNKLRDDVSTHRWQHIIQTISNVLSGWWFNCFIGFQILTWKGGGGFSLLLFYIFKDVHHLVLKKLVEFAPTTTMISTRKILVGFKKYVFGRNFQHIDHDLRNSLFIPFTKNYPPQNIKDISIACMNHVNSFDNLIPNYNFTICSC